MLATTEFALTQQLEASHRASGRTFQMLANAIERNLQTGEPSYVIVRRLGAAEHMRPMITNIAGGLKPDIRFISLPDDRPLSIPPRQIFRDHAAF